MSHANGDGDEAAPLFDASSQHDTSPTPRSSWCDRVSRSVANAPAVRWLSPAAIAALVVSSVAQYYSTSVLGLAMYTALDYSPQQTTLFWMYLSWVYWTSPFVGWLSDWLVFNGQRRRPTMLLGVALSCLAWAMLWIARVQRAAPAADDAAWRRAELPRVGDAVDRDVNNVDYASFVAMSIGATIAQMLITIPLNGIVVETATAASETAKSAVLLDAAADAVGHKVVGEVQAAAMLWKTVGSLLGAVIQTVVQVYVCSAPALFGAPVLYLLLVPVIVWLRYDTGTAAQARYATLTLFERFDETAAAVVRACRTAHRNVLVSETPAHQSACCCAGPLKRIRAATQHPLFALGVVLAFVFVYNATPDASVMYGQYLADHFEFSEWFLSMNQGVGLLGSVLGCELYARFVARLDQFRVFAVGCVAAGLCYATRVMLATGFSDETLRIPAAYFVPVDSFIVSVLTRIAFMPVLHVASERAPAGFEAFIFELFSVAAIGG
eukprot:CAMPEP_0174881006 /NCGR_PEP_ID=MMETSP1114-20130205/84045_1 /TAXON_ID=312471 /ORGANISM="Neobodo designis, Strain CCAP 1951/1" /LENGTH=494 /DNA_ID=CAMNT_0016116399 /DNA_START=56 /DNA_END=1538 /DNA_ORIENTATION=-